MMLFGVSLSANHFSQRLITRRNWTLNNPNNNSDSFPEEYPTSVLIRYHWHSSMRPCTVMVQFVSIRNYP